MVDGSPAIDVEGCGEEGRITKLGADTDEDGRRGKINVARLFLFSSPNTEPAPIQVLMAAKMG
jgi:hypothetical protein